MPHRRSAGFTTTVARLGAFGRLLNRVRWRRQCTRLVNSTAVWCVSRVTAGGTIATATEARRRRRRGDLQLGGAGAPRDNAGRRTDVPRHMDESDDPAGMDEVDSSAKKSISSSSGLLGCFGLR